MIYFTSTPPTAEGLRVAPEFILPLFNTPELREHELEVARVFGLVAGATLVRACYENKTALSDPGIEGFCEAFARETGSDKYPGSANYSMLQIGFRDGIGAALEACQAD